MTERPKVGVGGRIRTGIEGIRRTAGGTRHWWRAAPASGRVAGIVVGLAGAALLGAFLFGAWHVLFGWLVRGNWRASLFGLGLAAVTGLLLGIGSAIVRNRLRGRPPV